MGKRRNHRLMPWVIWGLCVLCGVASLSPAFAQEEAPAAVPDENPVPPAPPAEPPAAVEVPAMESAPATPSEAPTANAEMTEPAQLSEDTIKVMSDEEAEEAFEDDESVITSREFSAAQAIANLERDRLKRKAAIGRTRINNLALYDYKGITGRNDEEALREASVRALISTASRLYFGDSILIGRDLLEPYLRQYGDRFLTSRTVLKRRVATDGSVSLDVRVGVNVDNFYSDLEDKRFIGKPKVRPIIAVVLEENIDGQKTEDGRGRKILEDLMRRNELRVETERMGTHPLNVNVMESSDTLSNARDEAQRGEVEVILTGTLTVNSRGERDILYDKFTIYEAHIDLSLVRVDTGEVIGRDSEDYSAPALAGEAALERAFNGLMPRAINSLSKGLLEDWRTSMLDTADYRLMITNVSPEQLESVFNLLKTLSPTVEAHVKSFFGDVAVLNVYFPDAKPGQMETFLRKSRIPQFQVRPADDRRFELRIL